MNGGEFPYAILGVAMTTSASLDKRGRTIRDMFAGVAPRYDLLNHLLSGGLDVWWRRQAAARLSEAEKDRVLDLCCGTGDQTVALARRGARVQAVDFCVPMLARTIPKLDRLNGRPRPTPLAADALALPFESGSFSAATVSFGLRNVADLDRSLRELARVLRPGGRLLVIEPATPKLPVVKSLYLVYFRRILPRIGAWLSPRGSAYGYLTESVLDFPQRGDFLARMESAGLVDATYENLTAGIVCLYSAHVPKGDVPS